MFSSPMTLEKKTRNVFFIDNAADYATEIKIIQRAEQKDMVFVLADRQNELANARMLFWRVIYNSTIV